MDDAYTSELWGAAYIMNGGCSGDMFEYFRAWLIAQGRATFEAALKDPDTLAKASLTLGEPGNHDFESLLYAPAEAHEAKTGKELPRSPRPRKPEPSGEQWSEENGDLERRWPRLWKRFEELWT